MTRDEIISMAREASGGDELIGDAIERFAALVEAHERAACFAACQAVEDGENDAAGLAWECVDAIRARAEKETSNG